jgi:hypothetical protein
MARSLHTEIEIDAPVSEVWGVLIDWPSYPSWNPWMHEISGDLELGSRLDVRLKLGDKPMRFQPTLVRLEAGRSFAWLGHTLVRGLFDGKHAFELEELAVGRTRFVHREQFSGLLAGLVLRMIGDSTREGFETMNRALKQRCETRPGSGPSSV